MVSAIDARRKVGDLRGLDGADHRAQRSRARAPGTGSPCRGSRDRSCPWRRRRGGRRHRGASRRSREAANSSSAAARIASRRSAWRAARTLPAGAGAERREPMAPRPALMRVLLPACGPFASNLQMTDWSVIIYVPLLQLQERPKGSIAQSAAVPSSRKPRAPFRGPVTQVHRCTCAPKTRVNALLRRALRLGGDARLSALHLGSV